MIKIIVHARRSLAYLSKSVRSTATLSPKSKLQLTVMCAFFILWEIVGITTSNLIIPPLSKVILASFDLLSTSSFIFELQIGITSLVVGVVLGILSGISIGLLMGLSDTAEALLNPYLTVLYSLPIVALIPFIVLLLGTGILPRVFIIYLDALIPITINVLDGAKETSDDFLEVGTSFGASRIQNIRYIFFPSMVPYMITGSRLSVGKGMRGWILAELFFIIGVGGRLFEYGTQLRTAYVFAILFIFVLIGLVATEIIQLTSKILAPWYSPDSQRSPEK